MYLLQPLVRAVRFIRLYIGWLWTFTVSLSVALGAHSSIRRGRQFPGTRDKAGNSSPTWFE